ncbi:MAG TPA: DUF2252 domain-containing protein [Jatrophihabitantaceae bacterium]|jgi:hypothetical protein|nr:DUF2252 domain-containing protein [Jatrophihabitantaceae bacterium]
MAETTEAAATADEQAKRADRPSPKERVTWGKAARARVPLEAHADFRPAPSRDPVALLLRQAETRVPELVPIRHGRMLVSPFTFYRGAAIVMADDLATTPTPGLRTQLCGDAHLSNFGAYASPERRLVFDINDFDETLPGPFEWDVKRLVASFVVAGRDAGFRRKDSRRIALTAVESYRTSMLEFAGQPILTVWHMHIDVETVLAQFRSGLNESARKRNRARFEGTDAIVAKAHTRDSLQAVGKLITTTAGRRQIINDPPLIVPIDELSRYASQVDPVALRSMIVGLLSTYRDTLQSDRRQLLDHFSLTDIAHKVVGVGSVGTMAWILLLESGFGNDALLLQAKQAQESVLAAYAGASQYVNQGERVVSGQHLMQAASDIFLGWVRAPTLRGPDADFYIRQLRDWKASAELEQMDAVSFNRYARLCGWTLARAHARSGDRFAIAAYLGKSNRFDNAIADFAETYAEQNERDHAALAAAVASGAVKARLRV